MFDRCVCINLDRRPERWEAFCERLPRPWPFAIPERFTAVDGQRCPVPSEWRSGPGAYGCLISHLTLWQEASLDGATLLVFEDDALFVPDFCARAEAFLQAVPADWEMIYFGGMAIKPVEHRGKYVRCGGVKKTHAYVIRPNVAGLLERRLRNSNTHVDVSLSLLHDHLRVYAPLQWLCGQAPGVSDVMCGSLGEPERWFSFAGKGAT
jgi:glycosyl transferase family 25